MIRRLRSAAKAGPYRGRFSKGTMNVSKRDISKLRPLLDHYSKKPHPFTSCVRDNRKRFGPLTEKYCAVLKDVMRGTTSWRSTERKKNAALKSGEAQDQEPILVPENAAPKEFFDYVDGIDGEELAAWVAELEKAEGSTAPETQEPGVVAELTGPIVQKHEAQRIAFAAALVPGEADADGDVVSAEKIEEVANDWLENHRYMDEEHTIQDPVAVPVQSFTLPQEMEVEFSGPRAEKAMLPKGTWIIGSRIREDRWPDVVSGKLGGLSVMGVRKSDYNAALATAQKSATGEFSLNMKRVTLAELGDFITPAVSLVGMPAVPKGKWFALKSRDRSHPGGSTQAGGRTLLDRLLGRAGKSGREDAPDDEEVLEVEISRKELEELVQTKAEDLLTKMLAEAEDEGDPDDQVSFDTPEELNAHIEAQVQRLLDEASDDTEDDKDAEPSELEQELVATKSRLDALEKELRKSSLKSRHISGQGGQGRTEEPKTLNESLGRDAFGRARAGAR